MTNRPESSAHDRRMSASLDDEAEAALQEEVARLTQVLERKKEQIAHLRGPKTMHNVDFLTVQRPAVERHSLVDEHVREIAVLTEMVWERDRLIASLEHRSDWLTHILLLILRGLSRGRARLLPGSVVKRRLLARLAARGVFNGAAYLDANPDVAADGMDPLQHYVAHGLPEGRSSGLVRG